MSSKVLVEVLSPVGENLGFKKAVLGEDGIARLKRGKDQKSFIVRTDSQLFHRKKKRNYHRWVEGSAETLPRDAGEVDPVLTDVVLDMVAQNTFARDAMQAFRKSNQEKIQTIVMWVLVGVLVLGFIYIGSSMDTISENVKLLAPTTSPVATGARP